MKPDLNLQQLKYILDWYSGAKSQQSWARFCAATAEEPKSGVEDILPAWAYQMLDKDEDTFCELSDESIAIARHFGQMSFGKAVVVESPFAANNTHTEQDHRKYLERCLLDCIRKGESPYASHKMLTDCLNDSIPEERELGLEAGMFLSLTLCFSGSTPVFYTDLGWSRGMLSAVEKYKSLDIPFEVRKLPKELR